MALLKQCGIDDVILMDYEKDLAIASLRNPNARTMHEDVMYSVHTLPHHAPFSYLDGFARPH